MPVRFYQIFGCGGWTRTSDLRVMSPTSCQLLHPAMFYYSILTLIRFVNCFSIFSHIWNLVLEPTFLTFVNFNDYCPALKQIPNFNFKLSLSLHSLNHTFPTKLLLLPPTPPIPHFFRHKSHILLNNSLFSPFFRPF